MTEITAKPTKDYERKFPNDVLLILEEGQESPDLGDSYSYKVEFRRSSVGESWASCIARIAEEDQGWLCLVTSERSLDGMIEIAKALEQTFDEETGEKLYIAQLHDTRALAGDSFRELQVLSKFKKTALIYYGYPEVPADLYCAVTALQIKTPWGDRPCCSMIVSLLDSTPSTRGLSAIQGQNCWLKNINIVVKFPAAMNVLRLGVFIGGLTFEEIISKLWLKHKIREDLMGKIALLDGASEKLQLSKAHQNWFVESVNARLNIGCLDDLFSSSGTFATGNTIAQETMDEGCFRIDVCATYFEERKGFKLIVSVYANEVIVNEYMTWDKTLEGGASI